MARKGEEYRYRMTLDNDTKKGFKDIRAGLNGINGILGTMGVGIGAGGIILSAAIGHLGRSTRCAQPRSGKALEPDPFVGVLGRRLRRHRPSSHTPECVWLAHSERVLCCKTLIRPPP
jgi:hypothetical protein